MVSSRVNWFLAGTLPFLFSILGTAQQNVSAPSPVNQTQVNGVAVAAGNGVSGAGVQRVNVASDNSTIAIVEAAHAGTIVSTAATTAVKATAGTLQRIVFGTQVASATIKLFDLASASCTGTPSTNPKGVITLPSTVGLPFVLEYHLSFANGICVLTSGATNLAVIYD